MVSIRTLASVAAAVAAFSLMVPAVASAAFITPSYRPGSTAAAAATLTTYQSWTVFSNITGNTPNAGNFNPNGTATVGDTSGNGFNTSTGHLYALNGPMAISIVVPTYVTVPAVSTTQFLVQIENDGSELVPTLNGNPDFSNFKIDGVAISSLTGFSYTELSRKQNSTVTPGGTFTTNDVESEFSFSLPGVVTSRNFTFAVPANNSQVHISVDTIVATPEPATMSLLALLAPIALRRRRRTVVG